jgi:hypothetical protein
MFLTGSFSGTATFGTETYTSKGGLDLFATRISKTGSILHTITHGGIGNEVAYTISSNSASSILLAGSFTAISLLRINAYCSSGQEDGFWTKAAITTKYIAPIVNKVTCPGGNDGSIFTKVTGGTKPYEYLWSTGAITDSLTNISYGKLFFKNHRCKWLYKRYHLYNWNRKTHLLLL